MRFLIPSVLGLTLCVFSSHAASAKLQFPSKLSCETVDGRVTNQRLYTRLYSVNDQAQLDAAGEEGIEVWSSSADIGSPRLPKQDEVAYGWIGDYYSARVSKDEYRYSVWTCDSEDRDYIFKTEDLAIPADSLVESRHVTGKLTISIREDVKEFELRCKAFY